MVGITGIGEVDPRKVHGRLRDAKSPDAPATGDVAGGLLARRTVARENLHCNGARGQVIVPLTRRVYQSVALVMKVIPNEAPLGSNCKNSRP